MEAPMDVDPDGVQCQPCVDEEPSPFVGSLDPGLGAGFDELVLDVGKARDARRERMAFRSAAEVADEMVNADKVVLNDDEKQQLGEWLPGDTFQGDVNMRTLDRLLKRIDQRGYERSAQQLEFHAAFTRACGRVLYRADWATRKPDIMAKYGWEKCNSEVLIRFANALERTQTTRITNRARSCPAQHAAALWEDIFDCAPRRPGPRATLTACGRAGHLLRVHGAHVRPRDRCIQSSAPRLAQAARAGAH
jgi:hypothetical protein